MEGGKKLGRDTLSSKASKQPKLEVMELCKSCRNDCKMSALKGATLQCSAYKKLPLRWRKTTAAYGEEQSKVKQERIKKNG